MKTPPPMPPRPPKPPNVRTLRFIDKLTHKEYQVVYERVLARGRQLLAEDQLVSGVKRSYLGEIRHFTHVDRGGVVTYWRRTVSIVASGCIHHKDKQ